MRARRGDLAYFGALLVAFLLGVATLWCVDYLPTNDGPQHVFLGHAENLYSDPTTIYGRQFVPQLQFASRGFALWFNPLEPLLGFRDATRVVLTLFYSWSFGGYVLLVHALGKPRRWLALLGCAVPLCWPLYMGLFPYYAGLGIGLLLLAYVARRPTFDRRAALVVAAGLALQFVHHAFSVVPTVLFLGILVATRTERADRRATLVRAGLCLIPAAIGLLALVWVRPASPPGLHEFHWEPLARRALILPRVLWSGSTGTRWLGNLLLAAGFVSSLARFRRVERTERAYVLCAWTALALLIALPIVIPGWQFFNVRFAPFFVVFTLPLLPIEKLRRPALEGALCAAVAACLVALAAGFHRSLRAACADDLAGLSAPVTRTSFRFPLVLDPFCGLPRDATQAPVPFLGPARQLGALYATAQGGTIPNAFANVVAIHPFTIRTDDAAPHVPIPDEETLRFGEELSRTDDLEARKHELQNVAIIAQPYDDVLVFGATDADVATLGELGLRPAFRQRSFAMMELQPCKTEVVVEDHRGASLVTVGGGIGGRKEITWERRAKPGPVTPEGELVVPVSQRLCGPGWIRVRYQIGEGAFACGHTTDGKVYYVAKPGEVTRVRCAAPDL
ncbi:MAG: hypothetical protein JWO86_2664 [Myxococcaceae bacterium]|nr:hypothetical protein [Myxococcaceae bacterium]